MRRLLTIVRLATSLAPGLAAGCSGSAEAARPMRTLEVHTRDFAFDAPDTISAGLTTIRLENRGKELHHVQLLRISGGHDFGDFEAAVAAGGRLPAWAEPVGGPNVPGAGGSAVTLRLHEGTYAMICLVPSPTDGQSHFRRGMVHRLEVVPGTSDVVAAPKPDLGIVLQDYAFVVDSALPAGHHTVRVENRGRHAHELVLFRLADGKTPADFLAWAYKLIGPPPGVPSGGTTGIGPGGVNLMDVDLVRGDYVLVCFAADAEDHVSHVTRGMVTRFRVS